VVGQLYKLAQRLAADREDYKAADALLKLAKVQGWVNGEGSDKPVLANLTQADIDRVRAEYRAKQQQQQTASEEKEVFTGESEGKVN
jgi:hypothetical protein